MPIDVHEHLHQARLKCISQSMNQGALAQFDSNAAIEEIAAGRLMHQIAKDYGVDKSAIRKRLLKDIPQEVYKAAISSQAENLVDQATAELMEVGADAVLIARARARVDGAHKWAAARDPKNWAAKQEVTHNLPTGPLISITLSGNAPQLVDNSIDATHQRIESNE